jgi:hypothetical protein
MGQLILADVAFFGATIEKIDPNGILTSVLDDPSKGSNSTMYGAGLPGEATKTGFSISSEASAPATPSRWSTSTNVSLAI